MSQEKYKGVKEIEKPAMSLHVSLESWLFEYYGDDLKLMNVKHSFMGSYPALEFWKWLLESEAHHEHKRSMGNSIDWPYARRLHHCAMKFLKLTKKEQSYVLKARHHAPVIWWRGDDFPMFERITLESLRYHKTEKKDEYKKSIYKQAKALSDGIRAIA